MKKWFVKDKNNQVHGPFSDEDIIAQIRFGRFRKKALIQSTESKLWRPLYEIDLFKQELDQLNKAIEKKSRISLVKSAPIEKPVIELKIEEENNFDKTRIVQKAIRQNELRVSKKKKKIPKKGIQLVLLSFLGICLGYGVLMFIQKDEPEKKYGINFEETKYTQKVLPNDEASEFLGNNLVLFANGDYRSLKKVEANFKKFFEQKGQTKSLHAMSCMNKFLLIPYVSKTKKNKTNLRNHIRFIQKNFSGSAEVQLCQMAYENFIDQDFVKKGELLAQLKRIDNVTYLNWYYLIRAIDSFTNSKISKSAQYMSFQDPNEKVFIYELYKNFFKIVQNVNNMNIEFLSSKDTPDMRLMKYLVEPHKEEWLISAKKIAKASGNKLNPMIWAKALIVGAQFQMNQGDQGKAINYAKQSFKVFKNNESKRFLIKNGGLDKEFKANFQSQQILDEAEAYYKAKDWIVAQAYYKEAIEMVPGDASLYYKLGKTYQKLGFNNRAKDFYLKSIEVDKNFEPSWAAQIDLYLIRGKLVEAEEFIDEMKTLFGQTSEVKKWEARFMLETGFIEESILRAKKAMSLNPNDAQSLNILALAYEKKQDIKQAFFYSEQAYELSDDEEILRNYFRLHTYVHGVEESFNKIDQMIQYNEEAVHLLYYKLYSLYVDERYEKTIEFFESRSLFFGEDWEAQKLVTKSYEAIQKLGKSYEMLVGMIAQRPNDTWASESIGDILGKMGQNKEALIHYLSLKQAGEFSNQLYFKIASTYLKLRKFKNALEILQEIPDVKYQSESFLKKAEILQKMGDYASKVPDKIKFYEQCISNLTQYSRLSQMNYKSYLELAKCYRKSGDYDNALVILQKSQQLETGRPEVYLELGDLYWARGETKKAIHHYTVYVKLDPFTKRKVEIEKRIGKHVKN